MKWCIAVSIAVGLTVTPSPTQAADVTLEGKLKSVDAEKRMITVIPKKAGEKALEIEVGRKAEITVDGKEAALKALKVGQEIKIIYDDKLEIVSMIEVGKAGDDPRKKDDGFEPLLPNDGLEGWYFREEPKNKKPNWENKRGILVYKTLGPSLVSDKKVLNSSVRGRMVSSANGSGSGNSIKRS